MDGNNVELVRPRPGYKRWDYRCAETHWDPLSQTYAFEVPENAVILEADDSMEGEIWIKYVVPLDDNFEEK